MQTELHWHMGTGLNPFLPPGSLSPQLFTHKHTFSCRSRQSQALLNAISLSMPSALVSGVPGSVGSLTTLTWQACSWPASKRATVTSTLRPATKPALCATVVPAYLTLPTLHNTRSGGDTTVAVPKWLYNCCSSFTGRLAISKTL